MYSCPQLGFHIRKVYDEVNHQSPDSEKTHIPTPPLFEESINRKRVKKEMMPIQ